jgi:hypothetical protein
MRAARSSARETEAVKRKPLKAETEADSRSEVVADRIALERRGGAAIADRGVAEIQAGDDSGRNPNARISASNHHDLPPVTEDNTPVPIAE